jgi:hypothetical protein
MVPEILKLLFEGRPCRDSEEALASLGKVVRPDLSVAELAAYLCRYGRFYSDARSWIDAMARFDLAIGMRIHGAVAAIQAGRLGVCVAFDSRTLELAQTMGYPYIMAADIAQEMQIEDLIENVSFYPSSFDAKKDENLSRMWELFSSAGISTSLAAPPSVSDESFLAAVRDKLIQFKKPPAGIPEDFDDVHYFAANPDLLKARVNPYRHYLDSGRSEKRSYSASKLVA